MIFFDQKNELELGFPIVIPLREIAPNCFRIFLQLRAIFRSLQGSQLRASKIHLRWKPWLEYI